MSNLSDHTKQRHSLVKTLFSDKSLFITALLSFETTEQSPWTLLGHCYSRRKNLTLNFLLVLGGRFFYSHKHSSGGKGNAPVCENIIERRNTSLCRRQWNRRINLQALGSTRHRKLENKITRQLGNSEVELERHSIEWAVSFVQIKELKSL